MKNYITEKVIPIKFLPIHLDRIILDCIFLLTSPLQYCTHAIFKTAYYSLVHPHMSYGVRFWGNSSKNKILSIFVLQVSCKNSLPSRLWNYCGYEFENSKLTLFYVILSHLHCILTQNILSYQETISLYSYWPTKPMKSTTK